jgi:long-chain acyl-CoA synthetase
VIWDRIEDITAEPKSIIDLLQYASKNFNTLKAIELESEDGVLEISYRDLRQKAAIVAAYLSKMDVQPSDRVAIIAESKPEWAIVYFGILTSNAVAVPVDFRLKVSEQAYILNDCRARAVFISKKYFSIADSLRKFCSTVTLLACLENVVGEGEQIQENQLARRESQSRSIPSDVAMILYTSGSTGLPKGVELTHSNLLFEVKAFRHVLSAGKTDRILSVLPLNHALELICGLLGPLYSGACVVYIQDPRPDVIVSTLRRTRPTIVTVVPFLVNLIYRGILKKMHQEKWLRKTSFQLRTALSNILRRTGINAGRSLFVDVNRLMGGALRCFICGGAPLDGEIARRLDLMGVAVLQGYGLTEASPTVSVNTFGDNKLGSVGKPLPGVTVRIVKRRQSDIVGEIVVKGPLVMKGYVNDGERTGEVIRDGWLYTGDLGYIDNEGYLFVTGRAKTVIITSGGEKVQPEEIEHILLKSPYVKEVCVVGISARGVREGGEEVYAAVVPDVDYIRVKFGSARMTDSELNSIIEQVIHESSKAVADFKKIAGFELWRQELPKTFSGKIKRDDVLRQIRQRQRSCPKFNQGGKICRSREA